MVKRANLENLTKGARPALHVAEPNWDTLRGLVERAADALGDARRKSNTLATRFAAAYGAAFWLARVSLEAAGYRLAGAEGHRTTVFQCLAHTITAISLMSRRVRLKQPRRRAGAAERPPHRFPTAGRISMKPAVRAAVQQLVADVNSLACPQYALPTAAAPHVLEDGETRAPQLVVGIARLGQRAGIAGSAAS